MHAKQPSLPSIQHLLPDDVKPSPLQQRIGHRNTKSVSSLPTELQNLSIHGPANTITDTSAAPASRLMNNTALNKTTPSWMLNSSSPHQSQRSTHSSLSHMRSVSELDPAPSSFHSSQARTPPPPIVPQKPFTLQPTIAENCRLSLQQTLAPSPPAMVFSTSTSPRLGSPTQPAQGQPPVKQHRRAASANTVDFMLRHTMDENLTMGTVSTEKQSLGKNKKDESAAARYVCPYCQKRFSRPSSLRIHTYSHSGEKPFICPEPGCGRRFSVQSNQRRHLRVHRLGRHTTTKSPLRDGGGVVG